MPNTRTVRLLQALAVTATLVAGCGVEAPSAPAEPVDFGYEYLWPFASHDEAARWLRDGRDSSPWHGDPKASALKFAREYLGFSEMDRTTAVTENADEAWIGVGYASPNGRSQTAATVHLVRLGSTPDAPWEVVGTIDDTLSLTTPAYGHAVRTVIEAGGTITGVDESLHLQVRQSTKVDLLGDFCCVPAGGDSAPWTATVTTSPPDPGTITLVVWTGGHSADVERFAVTALRAS